MAKRKQYSPEFRAEATRLVLDENMAQKDVAKDLGIPLSSMSRWVRQARIDRGEGEPGELKSSDRDELRELRKKVRQLEMERDILKKAAAFFAKESL